MNCPPSLTVVLLLLLVVLLLPSTSAALPRIHVDRATGHFISMETKQRVILHGTNSVTKNPPFYSSFSDEEIDRFAYDWGFNVIRMGIEWIGIEPERGQHNYTYLQETKNLVKRFAERGVYTILDMHQDLYSPKICGNGAPDWAVVVDPVIEALTPFPMPVMGRTVFEYGEDGRISSEDCGKLPYWSFIYFTAVTGSAFQSLYDDARGIQQAFIDTWQIVATEFAGMTEVIGLELLNEPWPGRIYTEPGLLLRPGYADAKHLAPMYEKIHQAVRAVDNETIIFYEPHVSTSQVLPFSAGFEQGPGGAEFNDRQVFAFHHYCPTVDASGVPTNEIFCDWFAERSLEVRVVDSERLGGGSMLTEWGAFDNNAGAIEEMNTISQLADKFLMSWAHWEYKVITGVSLQDQLTFTYARKFAGLPISMYHDIPTSTFKVLYSALVSTSGETEIYLNEDVYYPSGFSVEISPQGAARWDVLRKNFIVVSHAVSVQDGDLITIQITKL